MKKLLSFLLTLALLSSSFNLAFAQVDLSITGNGAMSDNSSQITTTTNSDVFQTNKATVNNTVTINSNTGGNKMDGITGGKADLDTGDATINANITNDINANEAVVNPCDCQQDAAVIIENNGAQSTNNVNLDQCNTATVVQDNTAQISNTLDLNANTGDNDIEDLTGGGEVELKTGDVTIEPVTITNLVNSNLGAVGTGISAGGDAGEPLLLTVGGNGSDSTNLIDVSSAFVADYFQTNDSSITNDLSITGETGDNNIDDNTLSSSGSSPEVSLSTGNVNMGAIIDTAAGFNVASDDCGCITGVNADISANGTESASDITLDLVDDALATQENTDDFTTIGSLVSDTGDNDIDDNTNGDLELDSGDCNSNFDEVNTGGSNFFGTLPEMPQLSSVNIGAFMAALGIDVSVQ